MSDVRAEAQKLVAEARDLADEAVRDVEGFAIIEAQRANAYQLAVKARVLCHTIESLLERETEMVSEIEQLRTLVRLAANRLEDDAGFMRGILPTTSETKEVGR